jgi:putative DNA methylase
MKVNKKLIEVALPLEAINIASAREKSIRQGHPSTLHLWWARRPLAAARAVIFAQMVDDPSAYVDTLLSDPATRRAAQRELKKRQELWAQRNAAFEAATGTEAVAVLEPGARPDLAECAADIERERLFGIIEELVKWENTTNETVLERARVEIWRSWRRTCAANADHPRAKELFNRNKLPAFHDPFAGGGALPLEAQRLGLESYGTDLNPVAVLINKAMIEIPPRFAGKPPVNPHTRSKKDLLERQWVAAQGLVEDVQYYGQWMRDEAVKRIGHLYPTVDVSAKLVAERLDLKPLMGSKLTVIAWIWARTVNSPNPAFRNIDVPLASTFMLSTKDGKEAYIEPVVKGGNYYFTVKVGKPKNMETAKNGTKLSSGANFRCLMSAATVDAKYIRSEAKAGRMGARLMAVVCDGSHGRIYLPPSPEMEALARSASPAWKPELKVPTPCHDVDRLPMYGMPTWGDAFTSRQLVALTTLSDLVRDARAKVKRDAINAGLPSLEKGSVATESGVEAYADAVSTYLALAVDKAADYNSSFCGWIAGGETLRSTFGRQAISMNWDYCEANTLGTSTGSIISGLNQVAKALDAIRGGTAGHADQEDAQSVVVKQRVISTDPPYYDNISYADVSDFFYVWLRNSLKGIFPGLFTTLAVPKAEELVATPYRHGSKEKAEEFFLHGMTQAMHRLAEQAHPAFPVTIYYAFKQAESDGVDGTASTGWETFLDAVIRAGFAISGTWPVRTERGARSIGIGSNALASSIVLVCRSKADNLATATRREFVSALKSEMPIALAHLQHGNIAPVDLAQASIGPGMSVYTRYAKVVDAEGKSLTVRDALTLINQTLDEVLAEQEGDFDADSRWAVAWFEQMGFGEGEFGVADVLARAKVTAVSALAQDGIVISKGGKVRLLKPSELSGDWDPVTDKRLTVWEIAHQLIRILEANGEGAAAELVAKLGAKAEVARELAYRLYTVCERKKRAQEALSYNALVQSWPEIGRLARDNAAAVDAEEPAAPVQSDMFGRA